MEDGITRQEKLEAMANEAWQRQVTIKEKMSKLGSTWAEPKGMFIAGYMHGYRDGEKRNE